MTLIDFFSQTNKKNILFSLTFFGSSAPHLLRKSFLKKVHLIFRRKKEKKKKRRIPGKDDDDARKVSIEDGYSLFIQGKIIGEDQDIIFYNLGQDHLSAPVTILDSSNEKGYFEMFDLKKYLLDIWPPTRE